MSWEKEHVLFAVVLVFGVLAVSAVVVGDLGLRSDAKRRESCEQTHVCAAGSHPRFAVVYHDDSSAVRCECLSDEELLK